MPTGATAQTVRERDLEARVQQLEAALCTVERRLGAQSVAGPAPAIPAAELVPPPAPSTATLAARSSQATLMTPFATKPADGFRIGATTVKIGGFVRVNTIGSRYDDGEMTVGGLGKEFYLPQQIPVGNRFSSNDFLISARQTRLAFGTSTPMAGEDIKTHIEFDFALATASAGAQRATNPYTPTFRRGFIQYGNLLIGQEWSTFQNVAVLPETTDFVGPIEGTVFVRQGIIQYRNRSAHRLICCS